MTSTERSREFLIVSAAVVVALAQWPLSATFDNASGFGNNLALVLVSAGLGTWICLASMRDAPSFAIVLGSLLLTGGTYFGARNHSLTFFFIVSAGYWFAATVALVNIRSGAARATVAICALLLVGIPVESLARWLPTVRQPSNGLEPGFGTTSGQIEVPDHEAWRQLVPEGHARHVRRRLDGRLEFDAKYNTDRFASRAVPGRPAIGADWYLFGCSFTFGEGLNDDQTIGAQLQHLHPEARVFNFSNRGAGTSDSWIHLTRQVEAGEAPALSAYFFIYDHFRRAGLPDLMVATQGVRPRVVTVGGRPVLLGKAELTIGSAWDRFRINLLGRSQLYQMLASSWTPGSDTVNLIADLGKAMDNEIRARVPNGRFLFVFLPTPTAPWPDQIALLKKGLRGRGVDILEADQLMQDYEQRHDRLSTDQLYFGDGHPRAGYTALIATWLSDYLQQKVPNNGLSAPVHKNDVSPTHDETAPSRVQ